MQLTIAPVGTYILGSTQVLSNAEQAYLSVVEWIKKTSRGQKARAKRTPKRKAKKRTARRK